MGCCPSGENDLYEFNQQKRNGIPNIGNTCYMNSVIQALAGTKNFLQLLKTARRKELISLKKIIKALHRTDKDLSALAKDFKDNISELYSTFVGKRQNDAKELLIIILSILDEEPLITNPFNICYKKKFLCPKQHSFINEEVSNLIVIPKQLKIGITEYLEEMNSPKVFKGENKLFCTTCNELVDTTMETVRISCPKFMVLYLARNEGEGNNINFERYITFQNNSYFLYAVMVHSNNYLQKFFVLKHFYEYEIISDSLWYKYNDNYVSEVKGIANSKAYLLFYQQIYTVK